MAGKGKGRAGEEVAHAPAVTLATPTESAASGLGLPKQRFAAGQQHPGSSARSSGAGSTSSSTERAYQSI